MRERSSDLHRAELAEPEGPSDDLGLASLLFFTLTHLCLSVPPQVRQAPRLPPQHGSSPSVSTKLPLGSTCSLWGRRIIQIIATLKRLGNALVLKT